MTEVEVGVKGGGPGGVRGYRSKVRCVWGVSDVTTLCKQIVTALRGRWESDWGLGRRQFSFKGRGNHTTYNILFEQPPLLLEILKKRKCQIYYEHTVAKR